MDKSPEAFRTISEVAEDLDVPQHVLRFWETRFVHIRPLKRGGGRRYYRPDDVELLKGIRQLLYGEGYTIRGVQRILKEEGVAGVQSFARGERGGAASGTDKDQEKAAKEKPGFSEALLQTNETKALAFYPGTPDAPGLEESLSQPLQAALQELVECIDILKRLKTDAESGGRR